MLGLEAKMMWLYIGIDLSEIVGLLEKEIKISERKRGDGRCAHW